MQWKDLRRIKRMGKGTSYSYRLNLRQVGIWNIKNLLTLLVLFQSCNTSSVEKPIIQNEDTLSFEIENTTTLLSEDTFLISDFSVNGLKLGMPIKNAKKQLILCDSVILVDTEGWANVYHVYYQGEAIMSYGYKNNSTITMIEILSPIFHTKGGIRVCDNIRKIIGDTFDKIEQNDEIEDEDRPNNIDRDADTGYYFYFEEDGKYDIWFVFDKDGKILWIGLYCLRYK